MIFQGWAKGFCYRQQSLNWASIFWVSHGSLESGAACRDRMKDFPSDPHSSEVGANLWCLGLGGHMLHGETFRVRGVIWVGRDGGKSN